MKEIWIIVLLSCSSSSGDLNSGSDGDYETNDPNSAYNPEDGGGWDANLQLVRPYTSSSTLQLQWVPPLDNNVQLFQLNYTDSNTGTSKSQKIEANRSSYDLEGLKSHSQYELELWACIDQSCSGKITAQSNELTTSTSQEQWRIQGSSSEISSVERLIIGEDLQAYPFSSLQNEIEIFLLSEADGHIWKKTFFREVDDSLDSAAIVDVDVMNCSSCEDLSFSGIQVVHTSTNSAQLRLILEATFQDEKTQLYNLDLQEGRSSCELNVDCNLVPLFLPTDIQLNGFQYFHDSEQEFILIDGVSNCNQQQGIFVASVSEGIWSTSTDSDNCPRPLIIDATDPFLIEESHRLKLLFTQEDSLQFLYAPLSESIAFIDWENSNLSRQIVLQWPDQSVVSTEDFSEFSNFVFLREEENYLFFSIPALEDQPAGIVSAILLNP